MNVLHAIVSDLREKRLWPIALLLVAAIVAVPVLLASSAKPAAIPTTRSGQPPAPQATALAAVNVEPGPSHSRLTGSARDPFAQQAPATAASASADAGSGAVAGAPASDGGTGGTTAGSTAASSAPSPTSTTTATTETPTSSPATGRPGQPVRYFFYATDLAFGMSGTQLRVYRNVARLTPLPSPANPTLVFLGVKDGGKAAVFMVWSLSALSGDGTCVPSRTECSFLRLRPGQRETINAPNSQGALSTYTLKLAAIHVRSTVSLAEAKAANARQSSAGRHMLARVARGR